MIFRHLSALLALGTGCLAWRADLSEATQCGTVAVTWSATTAESIGPPFVLRVAAFGLAPLVFNMPASVWNSSSRAGSYSFTVPWPEGTQFVSAMDDGFGMGTGGVSGIQTVKSSSNSTCINASTTQPSDIFDVRGSFAQCSQVSMNWTEPAISQTRIAGLVPNGVAFQLDPPVTGSKSTTWDLNIKAGTAFALIYSDGSGNGLTSSLLKSLDSSTTQCLASGAYPSATATQTGVAEASTSIATIIIIPSPSITPSSISSNNNSRSNLGPILGAVFGALALLGALGLGVWVALRRRRRKQAFAQTPELSKGVDLDSDNARPAQHFNGNQSNVILPFVLPNNPSNGSRQQEKAGSKLPRKHPVRAPSRDTVDASDSSHVYTADTTVSRSNTRPRSEVEEEPMIIRHEDAGVIIPPRSREVIELPPGYDQLPRPPPPAQIPQQPRSLPIPPQAGSGRPLVRNTSEK